MSTYLKDLSLSFQHFLHLAIGRGIRNLRKCRQRKNGQSPPYSKDFHVERNLASQREMIKGGNEEKAGQKKEKWQEGCLDGNADAAAFSGA